MKKQLKVAYLITIIALLFITGFEQKTPVITLNFQHFVANRLLVLGDSTQNSFGEKMVIHKFKYYISNLVLVTVSSERFAINNSYYLIDEADSASKKIQLPNIQNNIASIEFMIGIDSIKNCSGIQTGALDPMLGMFWTWNSGYVFAKLEGASNTSKAAAHYFTYHIGGYKKGENAIRKISLPVSQKNNINPINIRVDINQWFNAMHPLKIETTPICHTPGPLAMQYADNYANMFSIIIP